MRKRNASWLGFAAVCGFLAGMAVMAVLMALYRPEALKQPAVRVTPAPIGGAATAGSGQRRDAPAKAIAVRPAGTPDAVQAAHVSDDVIEQLRRKRLEIPVQGVQREDLRDTFEDARGSSRRHQAIDVLAPRHTPVVAVEPGIIVRLFNSVAGGITVYQFDPTTTFAYYYAHLERYADGLEEGAMVQRGQVLGYVGTSGNAPQNTPHLHFAIFLLNDDKRWWQGTAVDPFSVLR